MRPGCRYFLLSTVALTVALVPAKIYWYNNFLDHNVGNLVHTNEEKDVADTKRNEEETLQQEIAEMLSRPNVTYISPSDNG